MPNNMELDRPHRPATSTSDLFICFTSRLSHSSSMRLSSKSILSPGRNDKPPVSLTNSLSRRLRTNNGSLKGGQSPMFPPGVVTSKKRGCAFENPEPSSPKVTCIGQVRVKTKKQGKKMKMNMKAIRARRITTTTPPPPTANTNTTTASICDAFRDFTCFIPCRSSSCGKTDKGENQGKESSSSSSCGGGVLRWFVAFNEGEGKTRDIELVVGEEEEERVIEREFSRRRSIFDDMDFNIDEICENVGGEGKDSKAEGSRVSICIPPKNALLLMRCRSDPVKMSALANKFWESSPTEEVEENEEVVVVREEAAVEKRRSCVGEDEKIDSFCYNTKEDGELIEESDEIVVVREDILEERRISVREDENIESFCNSTKEDGELIENRFSIDSKDIGNVRVSVSSDELGNLAMLFEDPEETEKKICQFSDPPESIEHQGEDLVEIQYTVIGKDSIFELIEDDNSQLEDEQAKLEETHIRSKEHSPLSSEEEEVEEKSHIEKPREEEASMEESNKNQILPDCLLLMMCEPKLSMEVSKETWVCSTDFLKPWLPDRHLQHQLRKINGGDEPKINKKNKIKKNRSNNNESNLPPLPPDVQPSRSSCSFPISMASLIEKKIVNAVAYEPFSLTRCKSEPMRTASAKLGSGQEVACFWKNRKIEPQPRRLLR